MGDRFVYQVSSNEIPVSVGGKTFELSVYDCKEKKFLPVLSVECEGIFVKVHLADWCKESILVYE